MSAVSGRRTFVRTIAAGVPAFAGAAALSPAAHAFPGLPARPGLVPHEGIDTAVRRIAALHNDLLRRRPTAADLREAAAHLRELIGYRLETNRDAEIPSVFRELISTHGRSAIITAPPDRAFLQAGAARYGLEAAAIPIGSASDAARATALDMLARRGAAFYYIEPLVLLDTLGYMLAENPGVCAELRELALIMEAATAVLCGAAQFFPPLAPECFAASVVLAFIKILEVLNAC